MTGKIRFWRKDDATLVMRNCLWPKWSWNSNWLRKAIAMRTQMATALNKVEWCDPVLATIGSDGYPYFCRQRWCPFCYARKVWSMYQRWVKGMSADMAAVTYRIRTTTSPTQDVTEFCTARLHEIQVLRDRLLATYRTLVCNQSQLTGCWITLVVPRQAVTLAYTDGDMDMYAAPQRHWQIVQRGVFLLPQKNVNQLPPGWKQVQMTPQRFGTVFAYPWQWLYTDPKILSALLQSLEGKHDVSWTRKRSSRA